MKTRHLYKVALNDHWFDVRVDNNAQIADIQPRPTWFGEWHNRPAAFLFQLAQDIKG